MTSTEDKYKSYKLTSPVDWINIGNEADDGLDASVVPFAAAGAVVSAAAGATGAGAVLD